jgi:hypothetical protein
MKHSILCLLSLCLLSFSASADNTSLDQSAFKTELNRVLDAKDWEGFLALSYTAGVTDYDWKMAEMLKSVIFDGRTVETIRFIELPEGFDSTFIYDGRFFEATLAPIGLVEVTSSDGVMKMPYALHEGAYYLVGTKSRSLNWDGPADRPLTIFIMGQGFEHVDARATWNVSGMMIEKALTHTSTNFNGQFVESVRIISKNEDVMLQLSLFESGEKIYTSDYLKGAGELSYQRTDEDKE